MSTNEIASTTGIFRNQDVRPLRLAKEVERSAIEKETILQALFVAGPQWGQRSPEEIISTLDAAGFMIVRKPTSYCGVCGYPV